MVFLYLRGMKKIIITLLIMFAVSCKAQTTIIPLLGLEGTTPVNTYIKDIGNDLDPFVGTYVYTSGGTTFKIVLQKITMVHDIDRNYYEDLLIGEIEYTEQYINELVFTTPQLANPNLYPYHHRIRGNSLYENNHNPYCNDCAPNEKRVRLSICDTRLCGQMFVRKIIVGGNPAIKIFKRSNLPFRRVGEAPIYPIIPDGEYILIKVN
jgi:hypothetical protein